ncbi:IS21 family transposase [Georgfuchsia toluolica]|nr:IS21 family transposase [Georgfuchsia toluolica]
MKQLGIIRRLYYRDGLSLSEIERRTGLTRKTVRRWLDTAEGTEPQYHRRPAEDTKIAPHVEWLTKALETDARRPKRDRRTALKLFGELQAAGFSGDYSLVTAFVRHWREDGGQALAKAYVPLHFELGEAFQFDWSEERLVIGGVWRKILAAHLKLCASRAFVLQAYPTQNHEMLFDAHTRSFAALGGIPRRGIYDNMKTAVDKVKQRKLRTVNTRFAAMASHYLFDPDFCNVASGWEKGIVEKNVQDSRQRIWQDAAKERFGSFAELNLWLLAKCRALWQELRHTEYGDLTLAEMLEHEQPSLMPMVTPFDGYVETLGKVSSVCLVSYDRNRYSAPCELVGQIVSIRIYPDRIDFVAHDAVVASHLRCFDRNQTCYDWQHYIPLIERKPGALRNGAPFADMPAPLQQLRRLLLKRDGGDRVMAKVLAAVPQSGLEAVLVAVELVLESANPSSEHVENVLNRLKNTPVPTPVETMLAVCEVPIVDTERYDSLREEVVHDA